MVALTGLTPAWATDGDGQNAYAKAQASGGVLTVQAGLTTWIPPAGSSWAERAHPDPPGGAPNPNQPYGCTYTAGGPQATAVIGPGGPLPGQWVFPTCAGPGFVDPLPGFWVSGARPPVAGPVSPVALARRALDRLALGSPGIEMAPPASRAQLVGVSSWLWLDPSSWRVRSATASVGPVRATATARPSRVVWDLGDGHTLSCPGPGVPYDPNAPNRSTYCSYRWPAPGRFRVTATVYWAVTWTATGAPGGGTLGVQAGPASVVRVQVEESQAINTPTGAGE